MKPAENAAGALTSPDSLFELVFAFQRSRALLTAFELEVFTALGDSARPSADVAKALGTDPRATDRLMSALCAMGLMAKENERFSNTPFSAQFLVKGKPDYLAGLGHGVNLWDSWSTLTQAVRDGESVIAHDIADRGDDWLGPFIAAMHARARRSAPGVVAPLDLAGVSRVLDVGGGSGAYAMAFARARADLRATVFDLPNVIPLTRGYIAAEGMSDKVDFAVGDYNSDSLGKGYDLVFLSAIVHSNSDAQNRALIRKCADALNPAGQVVVQDFIMDEDRTSPAFGAMFALNMLVNTESGDTYTESKVRSWMEEAGLSRIARQDTEFGTTLIVGRKE